MNEVAAATSGHEDSFVIGNFTRLLGHADRLASQFETAQPFPHAVIDNLFDDQAYSYIKSCFPPVDSDIWKTPTNVHTQHKMVTKRGADDIKEMLYSPAARSVLRDLISSPFLRFLEKLSGIHGLMGDPHFAEAGFQCSSDGGFVNVHADFSHHDHLGLERRLNLIFYLNDDWLPEFGGHLGLYDLDLQPVEIIEPIGNRAAIFATSDSSYHGHPSPMELPEGTYRRSIALYYYTLPTERGKSRIHFPADPEFNHQPTND